MTDELLWQAMEEVDALTPACPPIAPPRPPRRSLVGVFVRGMYVVAENETTGECVMSNGARVPTEWVEDNLTSPARV